MKPSKSAPYICILFSVIHLVSSFISHQTSTFPISSSLHATSNRIEIPPGILGPPVSLSNLGIGETINAFRSSYAQDDAHKRHDFTIQRLSSSPNVFLLRSFLTSEECQQIQYTAEANGMKQAETVSDDGKVSRKNCQVSWLNANQCPTMKSLVSSTINIFLSHQVKSHQTAGVEDLQVLKYSSGGEFIHHHDGDARILTVIYYLNGVAGTWFPLAAEGSDAGRPMNKMQALERVESLESSKDGLLLSGAGESNNNAVLQVNPGDAVAFYNYLDDGSGQLDWNTLHCGLPTSEKHGGTKWIANHWYRLNVLEGV